MSSSAAQAKFDEICTLCDGRSKLLAQIAEDQRAQLNSLELATTAFYSRFRTAGRLAASQSQRLLDRNHAIQDVKTHKVVQVDLSQTRLMVPLNRPPADYSTLPRPGNKQRVLLPARTSSAGRQVSVSPLVSLIQAGTLQQHTQEEEKRVSCELKFIDSTRLPPPASDEEKEESLKPKFVAKPPPVEEEDKEVAKPPPPPRTDLVTPVEEEEVVKPPPPPPKPVAEEKVAKPPPPPPKVQEEVAKPPPPPLPKAQEFSRPVSVKRTQEETDGPKPGGGLAARQAMLAAMMGGGGPKMPTPGAASSGAPTSNSGGGNNKPLPKEALPVPKKLNTSAANELAKKLGGAPAAASSKDLSKYEKMKKTGLPQGAIEHAMIKDGVDPKLLFQ